MTEQTRQTDVDAWLRRYRWVGFAYCISPAKTRCPAVLHILVFFVRFIVGKYARREYRKRLAVSSEANRLLCARQGTRTAEPVAKIDVCMAALGPKDIVGIAIEEIGLEASEGQPQSMPCVALWVAVLGMHGGSDHGGPGLPVQIRAMAFATIWISAPHGSSCRRERRSRRHRARHRRRNGRRPPAPACADHGSRVDQRSPTP